MDNIVHEKVFGLFIENALPQNFLLIFGSEAVLNLNAEVHLPVVEDNPEGEESNWIEPWGLFCHYLVENVDISNNLSGELYLENTSGLFINNGLKECIYVFYGGKITLINKYLPVRIFCPVQFPHYLVPINHVANENVPELSAAEYLRRRDRLNKN
jgi:hypothetical protein